MERNIMISKAIFLLAILVCCGLAVGGCVVWALAWSGAGYSSIAPSEPLWMAGKAATMATMLIVLALLLHEPGKSF
ncbi:hypothetical protein [Methylobacterium sp. 17Sr1-1]|uniref:hypothetical protein n=1 Tax=Methylobacterium sp. 17Sr1-1 TaxID=2202826 RepID=UPI000D6FB5BB|nr:hypothetical protein [Methylobacterium sp. 17Sr1-1]AWN55030.1 hypothetical protein DK412_28260 [Methylobacterium sp. 17Sr1-1]